MKISYIAPIDRLRGAIKDAFGTSGIVAADSPTAGKWARRYVRPTNNMTAHQILVRAWMSAAALSYKGLLATKAAAWEALARAISRRDSLNATYQLTGIEVYVQVNTYRQMQGQSITTTAPTFSSPIAAQTATVTAGSLQVTIAGTATGVADTAWLYCRVTQAIAANSQARQARENELRTISDDYSDSFTNPTTGTYTITLPTEQFALVAQNRIGLEIRTLDANYLPGGRLFLTNVNIA